VSSDSIVKGIIDDIIKTAVKTAEVDDQKTKYLQHFINKHDTIVSIKLTRDHHGRDRMVVGFTTTYAISAYHH
jgi:hypothetical protein